VDSRFSWVSVECHAGYRGEETPVRFRLGQRLLHVDEVRDRWLAPEHRYFKVRVGGDTYHPAERRHLGCMGTDVFESG